MSTFCNGYSYVPIPILVYVLLAKMSNAFFQWNPMYTIAWVSNDSFMSKFDI